MNKILKGLRQAVKASEAVTVRLDDAGGVDEVFAEKAAIHIERMSGHGWFIGVTAADGTYWQFWLGAKNMRSVVEMRHAETDGKPLS